MLKGCLTHPSIEKLSSFKELKEKQLIDTPDIIIMDDYITGASSVEIITFLRYDRRLECLVYLFCESVTDNVKNSIKQGANRYFAKPFNLEAIANEILKDLKTNYDPA